MEGRKLGGSPLCLCRVTTGLRASEQAAGPRTGMCETKGLGHAERGDHGGFEIGKRKEGLWVKPSQGVKALSLEG